MEEHWEEGGANEGDAAQVWRESGRGKSSGNRAGLIKHTRQVCRENMKNRKEKQNKQSPRKHTKHTYDDQNNKTTTVPVQRDTRSQTWVILSSGELKKKAACLFWVMKIKWQVCWGSTFESSPKRKRKLWIWCVPINSFVRKTWAK